MFDFSPEGLDSKRGSFYLTCQKCRHSKDPHRVRVYLDSEDQRLHLRPKIAFVHVHPLQLAVQALLPTQMRDVRAMGDASMADFISSQGPEWLDNDDVSDEDNLRVFFAIQWARLQYEVRTGRTKQKLTFN
jgi:hypothetical protein